MMMNMDHIWMWCEPMSYTQMRVLWQLPRFNPAWVQKHPKPGLELDFDICPQPDQVLWTCVKAQAKGLSLVIMGLVFSHNLDN